MNGDTNVVPRERFHRWVFKHTPAIILAEPFECFLIAYGVIIGLIITFNVFLGGSESPQLYDVLPRVLLLTWAGVFIAGSILIGLGLARASATSAVKTKSRRFEVIGLCITGSALLVYLIASPLRLPHDNLYHWSVLILGSLVLLGWVVAIGVRLTLITSSVFLLATNRLTRIRLLKEELRREDSDG